METFRVFFRDGSSMDVEADYARTTEEGFVCLWVKSDNTVDGGVGLFASDAVSMIVSVKHLKDQTNRLK